MCKNLKILPKDIVEYIISFDPEGLIKRENEIEKKKIQIVCKVIMELMQPDREIKWGAFGHGRMMWKLSKDDENFKMTKQYNGYWAITHQGNKFVMKSN